MLARAATYRVQGDGEFIESRQPERGAAHECDVGHHVVGVFDDEQRRTEQGKRAEYAQIESAARPRDAPGQVSHTAERKRGEERAREAGLKHERAGARGFC